MDTGPPGKSLQPKGPSTGSDACTGTQGVLTMGAGEWKWRISWGSRGLVSGNGGSHGGPGGNLPSQSSAPAACCLLLLELLSHCT